MPTTRRNDLPIIEDAAHALGSSKPGLGGIFSIASGVPVSYVELAEAINRVFHNAGNLRRLEDREADETVQYLDCDRAARELGWQSRWSLEIALQDLRKTLESGQKTPSPFH